MLLRALAGSLRPLSRWLVHCRRPAHRANLIRYRPRFDIFEERLAPATFTVNDPGIDDVANPNDHTALTRNNTVTLVSALEQNQYDGGGDVIQFSGPMTITTGLGGRGSNTLPVTLLGIKQGNGPGVIISNALSDGSYLLVGDGSTVSDLYLLNTVLAAGNNCTVDDVYTIGGNGLPQGIYLGNNSTLQNSVVSGHNFGDGTGALLQAVYASDGCTIQNNFIGTTIDGTGLLANTAATGLVVGSNNLIRNNVLAGNQLNGLEIRGNNNQVQGNKIGTDVSGTVALANGQNGIVIVGNQNIIGGSGGAANLISGNIDAVPLFGPGAGIRIYGGNNNIIQGNRIGTDISGTQALSNRGNGIDIYSATGTIIGGAGAGNLISGNVGDGIHVTLGGGTIIQGNYIGTDITGSKALGNSTAGVVLDNASLNTIGGTSTSAGNLIAANKAEGIAIVSSRATGNQILGNYVGTNPSRQTDLGNGANGVLIRFASHNTVGGTASGEANLIAFNGMGGNQRANGVQVVGAIGGFAVGNTIRGNSIYQNNGLGIALGSGTPFIQLDPNAGPGGYAFTLNDPQRYDPVTALVTADNQLSNDNRPNHLQHYPVYLGRDAQGIGHWQLNSTPGHQFEIDFYGNTLPNRSGFGDGETFLSSISVLTDANGHVVFPTPSGVDGQPYVGATATDAGTGDTSQFAMVSTSGDGLADAWKMWGIDVNGDGTSDLALPGSDVNHRDLYVEIDAMAGRAPSANALDVVTQAFAAHGIGLHLELGDTNVPVTGPWRDDPGTSFPGAAFDTFKTAHFGIPAAQGNPLALAAERLAYRYCIFADTYQEGTDPVGRPQYPSGAGEGFIANDFFIALGPIGGGNDFEQAGTFMHELGHSLGLRHGGGSTAPDGSGDDIGYKPNYFSVMNYLWQTPFTAYADPNNPTADELAYHSSWELDYSEQALPTLDEGALDEAVGIGGDPMKILQLADGSGQFVAMGGPVDWNQDGIAGNNALVQRPVNGDSRLQVLVGHEDWSQLNYYFLESPFVMDGVHGMPLRPTPPPRPGNAPRATVHEPAAITAVFARFSSAHPVGVTPGNALKENVSPAPYGLIWPQFVPLNLGLRWTLDGSAEPTVRQLNDKDGNPLGFPVLDSLPPDAADQTLTAAGFPIDRHLVG